MARIRADKEIEVQEEWVFAWAFRLIFGFAILYENGKSMKALSADGKWVIYGDFDGVTIILPFVEFCWGTLSIPITDAQDM
jgi:hypothetical protein